MLPATDFTRSNGQPTVRSILDNLYSSDIWVKDPVSKMSVRLQDRLVQTPSMCTVRAATNDVIPAAGPTALLAGIVDGVTLKDGDMVLFLGGTVTVPSTPVVFQRINASTASPVTLRDGMLILVLEGAVFNSALYWYYQQGSTVRLVRCTGGGGGASTAAPVAQASLQTEAAVQTGITPVSLVGPSTNATTGSLRTKYLLAGPGIRLQSVDTDRGIRLVGSPSLQSIVHLDDIVASEGQMSIANSFPLANPAGLSLTYTSIPALQYAATTATTHNGSVNIRLLGIPAAPVGFDLECTVVRGTGTSMPVSALTMPVQLTMPNATNSGPVAIQGSLTIPLSVFSSTNPSPARCTVVWDTTINTANFITVDTGKLVPAPVNGNCGADVWNLRLGLSAPLTVNIGITGIRLLWWAN